MNVLKYILINVELRIVDCTTLKQIRSIRSRSTNTCCVTGCDAETDGERSGALDVVPARVANALHDHHQQERDQGLNQDSLVHKKIKLVVSIESLVKCT